MSVETRKSVCFWCKAECGVLVNVENNRLLSIEEDPDWFRKVYPSPKGCPRRKAAKEYFYHPDRVNYPLKRTGERGENKWEKIPWNQALDEIAEQLKNIREKYGPESLGVPGGTGRTHYEYGARFTNLFGTPNYMAQERICMGPRSIVADMVTGMFPLYAVTEKSKCILLIGIEPLVSRPINGKLMLDALKNGAKLIVVDPRKTRSASKADIWLPIRPATDSALLLGMIRYIIDEKLYDEEFVANWCHGFEELKERVKEYPIDKVAAITGLPADKIIEAVRIYATTKPAVCLAGEGLEHVYTSAPALHATWILAALTGNLDVEGGEVQWGPPGAVPLRDIELADKLSPEQWRKQIGADRFRLSSWDAQQIINTNIKKVWGASVSTWYTTAQTHTPSGYSSILSGDPYPLRALICTHANPLVTEIGSKTVYKAMKSPNLELNVVIDFFLTPTAQLADYVLPAACWLERPNVWTFHDYSSMWTHEAALPHIMPGEYEHYRDFDIWRELGLRLGQKEYWPWETLERAYDDRLKPLGYTLKTSPQVIKRKAEFKKYEKQGFATSTGKVELYSTVLEKLGYDPLPYFKEAPETQVGDPELAREYPLTLLTGGRVYNYYHSEWRQVDAVRKRHPYPLLQINPNTARSLEINDGDWVWIETSRGRVRHKAKLFEGIKEDTVHAEHGWWLPELPGEEPWLHGVWEVNINMILSDDPEQCNPELGSWPFRTALCKVYKAKSYE